MKRSTLSTAVAAGLLGFSISASAASVIVSSGFSGYYAPAQWTIGHTANDFGSVDTSGAPGSITLIGSDTNPATDTPSRVDFTIVAQGAGTFSFDWSYSTTDPFGAFYDPAGYILGSIATGQFQLTNNNGLSTQSGQKMSFSVAAGQLIGFHATTQDNYGGSASLTISNFSAPVPEPSSMAMMALGLLGLAGATAARRRRQA